MVIAAAARLGATVVISVSALAACSGRCLREVTALVGGERNILGVGGYASGAGRHSAAGQLGSGRVSLQSAMVKMLPARSMRG